MPRRPLAEIRMFIDCLLVTFYIEFIVFLAQFPTWPHHTPSNLDGGGSKIVCHTCLIMPLQVLILSIGVRVIISIIFDIQLQRWTVP